LATEKKGKKTARFVSQVERWWTSVYEI